MSRRSSQAFLRLFKNRYERRYFRVDDFDTLERNLINHMRNMDDPATIKELWDYMANEQYFITFWYALTHCSHVLEHPHLYRSFLERLLLWIKARDPEDGNTAAHNWRAYWQSHGVLVKDIRDYATTLDGIVKYLKGQQQQ